MEHNLVIPDEEFRLVGEELLAFGFRKGGHFVRVAPVPSDAILIELYGTTVNDQVRQFFSDSPCELDLAVEILTIAKSLRHTSVNIET